MIFACPNCNKATSCNINLRDGIRYAKCPGCGARFGG